MLIDGQLIAVPEAQQRQAREQLDLPSGFALVEATQLLQHETGNGVVQIPLPAGLFVAAFEDLNGQRRYGVVTLEVRLT
ncbi:hypothetical protein [Stutzerimonas kunmingensis]|uniref:hypothetical protein n=1 Tax=Stutzerimonas kunmingensis TaxID=1211807 RepID=UPI001F48EC2A|nr:hypothetical protein [Stutzerimonas kunmingensis]UIP32560.1 hypothetical protein LW136_20985 [Stutzerimonas kunmingensis]